MSIRNLPSLFAPRSIALIGASDRPLSIGATLMHNLLAAPFAGTIYPVNPRHAKVAGQPCYHRIADLPHPPDLAVICTPAASVPGIVAALAQRGTRAALVLSAGLDAHAAGDGSSLRQAMLDAAGAALLRIVGPGDAGLQLPALGINASTAHTGALPGKLALLSQSGALAAGVLDWASSRGIGFSAIVTLGASADVDCADVLDYLAGDAATRAILMYVEQIPAARKFMSAARAAARSKPTVLIKAGRAADRALAGAAQRAAAAAHDAVWDAAIRRAGMLRVASTEDLFDAVGALANARPQTGERLAIVGNGAGLGVLAADALAAGAGQLAVLSLHSVSRLAPWLPGGWSAADPVALPADSAVERYVGAMEVLQAEPECDAILFIHAPTANFPAIELARALVAPAQSGPRQVFACWFGGDAMAPARHLFSEAGIATFNTPEQAVRAFQHVVRYRRNQRLLMEVPPSAHAAAVPQRAAVRAIVESALDAGGGLLDGPAAGQLLAAYGMAVADAPAPPAAHALRVGVATDPVFGPVILVGGGGHGVDAMHEHAVGLPPLNMVLARDMVAHTPMARLLAGGPGHPPAAIDAICRVLVLVSQLVVDVPELCELDIGPLLADGDGVVAHGARLRLARCGGPQALARLAIRPYPQELERTIDWQGAAIVIRPVKPEDGPAHDAFFHRLAAADVRFRAFGTIRELQPAQLARLTQIDYDREMAFIASRPGPDGVPETLGVARAVADPDNVDAEFAVIVRSDLKGQGLGRVLMQTLIDYFRARHTHALVGEALPDNARMLAMAGAFGFALHFSAEREATQLRLLLQAGDGPDASGSAAAAAAPPTPRTA